MTVEKKKTMDHLAFTAHINIENKDWEIYELW